MPPRWRVNKKILSNPYLLIVRDMLHFLHFCWSKKAATPWTCMNMSTMYRIYIFLHCTFIPTVQNSARSSFPPPQCTPWLRAQYCEAWSELVSHIATPFTPFQLAINPSAWGHLNPSSYYDVGRIFYGVFKLWSKLQRKKWRNNF